MGTTIWSPLASGALTGKYLDGIPEGSRATLKGYEWLKKHMIDSERGQARMEKVKKLKPIADELGVSLSKIIYSLVFIKPKCFHCYIGCFEGRPIKRKP